MGYKKSIDWSQVPQVEVIMENTSKCFVRGGNILPKESSM